MHYNSAAGVRIGLVVACAAVALVARGALPPWGKSIGNEWFNSLSPGGPDRIDFSNWCLLGYAVGFVFGIGYWEACRRKLPSSTSCALTQCSLLSVPQNGPNGPFSPNNGANMRQRDSVFLE